MGAGSAPGLQPTGPLGPEARGGPGQAKPLITPDDNSALYQLPHRVKGFTQTARAALPQEPSLNSEPQTRRRTPPQLMARNQAKPQYPSTESKH